MNKAITYILVVVAGAGWAMAWRANQALEEATILTENYVKSAAENEANAAIVQGNYYFIDGPGVKTEDRSIDGKPLQLKHNSHHPSTADLFASTFNSAMSSRLARLQKEPIVEEEVSENQ